MDALRNFCSVLDLCLVAFSSEQCEALARLVEMSCDRRQNVNDAFAKSFLNVPAGKQLRLLVLCFVDGVVQVALWHRRVSRNSAGCRLVITFRLVSRVFYVKAGEGRARTQSAKQSSR